MTDNVNFSVTGRREIERERLEARRKSYARAKRILGRLAYERGLSDLQAYLWKVERRAFRLSFWRRTVRPLALAAIAAVRDQFERFKREDGPDQVSASDEVALTIVQSWSEPSDQNLPGKRRPGPKVTPLRRSNGVVTRTVGDEIDQ